jgi:hypothetical protein
VIQNLRIESDELSELIKARIEFDKQLLNKPIGKDAKGNRGAYMSLENLQEQTIALMAPLGLTIKQTTIVDNGNEYLVTTLRHQSGQFERSIAYLFKHEPQMDGEMAKLAGSLMTYTQRYQWRSLLGIGRGSEDIEDTDTSNDNNYITKAQSYELYNLMRDHKDIQSQMFDYYKISHSDKLPKEKFEEAKTVVKQKIAAKKIGQ